MTAQRGDKVMRMVEWSRQEVQVKPHEGFATGVIGVREDERAASAAPRTLVLAKPPAWTQQKLPCHGRYEEFHPAKKRGAGSKTDEARANELCKGGGCPVISECLEDTLRYERGLDVRNRYGYAGGLSPLGRLTLEQEKPVCPGCGKDVPRRVGGSCTPCTREGTRRRSSVFMADEESA